MLPRGAILIEFDFDRCSFYGCREMGVLIRNQQIVGTKLHGSQQLPEFLPAVVDVSDFDAARDGSSTRKYALPFRLAIAGPYSPQLDPAATAVLREESILSLAGGFHSRSGHHGHDLRRM